MEVSQKLNTQEIQALLAGLDLITIKGNHARLIADLQDKLEKGQQTIVRRIEQEEQKKEKAFQEMAKK